MSRYCDTASLWVRGAEYRRATGTGVDGPTVLRRFVCAAGVPGLWDATTVATLSRDTVGDGVQTPTQCGTSTEGTDIVG